MMNKPTIAQLAAYGKNLQIYTPDVTVTIGSYNFEKELIYPSKKFMLDDECISVNEVTPLLRSMNNLNKPIVVEGYNESKEFIPSVEIKNQYGSSIGDNYLCFWGGDIINCYPTQSICNFGNVIDLLNQWQFDYRGWIDAGYAKELKD